MGRDSQGGRCRVALALLTLALAGCRQCGGSPDPGPVRVLSPEKAEVEVLVGGDTSLARHVNTLIKRRGKGDPAWALARIAPRLRKADLVFLNLESVYADSGEGKARDRWLLRAPTGYLAALPASGVHAVTLANNHALDYGRPGMLSTLQALEEHGVSVTGVQTTEDERQAPLLLQVGTTRLALLGYNRVIYGAKSDFVPRPHWYERDRAVADVQRAVGLSDAVIVAVHWGDEYSLLPRAREQEEARALVDAGADVVAGHHPHVPQPAEEYGDGLIVHSLGNFLFDMIARYKWPRTRRTLLLSLTYRDGRRTGWKLLPVRQDRRYRPRLDPRLDVASWTERPPPTPYDFTSHLRDARVTRLRDGKRTRCKGWRRRHLRVKSQYLQWLEPRWSCPGEKDRPHLTVAATGERSGSVFRRGIWAHPHEGGPLVLAYTGVPLSARLRGHAGIPDYGVRIGKGAGPVEARIVVDGLPEPATFSIPHRAGWVPLEVDTHALAGQRRDVRLEVRAASGKQRAFVVGLWVEANP